MSVSVLPRVISSVVAVACGIQAAVAVFFAPVVLYGDDQVLLVWGWIAPFVALPTAFAIGWLVRKVLVNVLGSGTVRFQVAVIVASLALVAAVSYFMLTHGNRNLYWSEQLTLRDGSTLVVKRNVIGNSFGRSRSRPQDWLPSSFGIEVAGVAGSAGVPVWHSPLRPVLLEKLTASGNLVLVAEAKDCGEWYALGKPNPPYHAYELRANAWHQSVFPQELLGLSANLLKVPRFTGEGPGIIGAAEVTERNNVGPKDSWPVIRAISRC